jgi:RNA polymerase sigma-70 factor (ECF subfamily)
VKAGLICFKFLFCWASSATRFVVEAAGGVKSLNPRVGRREERVSTGKETVGAFPFGLRREHLFRQGDPSWSCDNQSGSLHAHIAIRKATADLIALHSGAVYGYIIRRMAPRQDLVDDLVQEVFLAAWTHLADYRGDAPLRAWLLGIARHKVEDYYRGRLRDWTPLPDESAQPPPEASALPSLDAEMDRSRAIEKVQQILASLPEAYAIVLLWRYWERRSAQEMADSTGKSVKGIERLLARAREQFKRRWDDERP